MRPLVRVFAALALILHALRRSSVLLPAARHRGGLLPPTPVNRGALDRARHVAHVQPRVRGRLHILDAPSAPVVRRELDPAGRLVSAGTVHIVDLRSHEDEARPGLPRLSSGPRGVAVADLQHPRASHTERLRIVHIKQQHDGVERARAHGLQQPVQGPLRDARRAHAREGPREARHSSSARTHEQHAARRGSAAHPGREQGRDALQAVRDVRRASAAHVGRNERPAVGAAAHARHTETHHGRKHVRVLRGNQQRPVGAQADRARVSARGEHHPSDSGCGASRQSGGSARWPTPRASAPPGSPNRILRM